MSFIRVMLLSVGAICSLGVLALVPQFSHATYYGDSHSGWELAAIAAGLICIAALCSWASGKVRKGR